MNPDLDKEVYPGEWRPECFGRTGYGDGYDMPGRCDIRVCSSGGDCYRKVREEAERRDPEAAAEYEERRKVLRGEGLDSMSIVRILAAQGFPPPSEDVVLANYREGQLASGLWRECRGSGCTTLVRKSHDSVYCAAHEPRKEGGDGTGPAHDGRELQAGARTPAPPTAGRLGSAEGPPPPVKP